MASLDAQPDPLFSASEQSSLLGFLDAFEWQFDPLLPSGLPTYATSPGMTPPAPLSLSPSLPSAQPNGHNNIISLMDPSSTAGRAPSHDPSPVYLSPPPLVYPTAPPATAQQSTTSGPAANESNNSSSPPAKRARSSSTRSQSHSNHNAHESEENANGDGGSDVDEDEDSGDAEPGSGSRHRSAGARSQLSAPQKRMNHIMSEQRRRNTIRDGYATLTTMLAAHPKALPRPPIPKGKVPRGRDRRGNKIRTKGKGKSGVLFRAVEYIRWLDEGIEDMENEILKLEAAVRATNPGSIP